MTSFDWQLVAVIACVVWAATVFVRRVIALFSDSSSPDCGSGGCSTCPSATTAANAATQPGFVSLQSLEQSIPEAETPH